MVREVEVVKGIEVVKEIPVEVVKEVAVGVAERSVGPGERQMSEEAKRGYFEIKIDVPVELKVDTSLQQVRPVREGADRGVATVELSCLHV